MSKLIDCEFTGIGVSGNMVSAGIDLFFPGGRISYLPFRNSTTEDSQNGKRLQTGRQSVLVAWRTLFAPWIPDEVIQTLGNPGFWHCDSTQSAVFRRHSVSVHSGYMGNRARRSSQAVGIRLPGAVLFLLCPVERAFAGPSIRAAFARVGREARVSNANFGGSRAGGLRTQRRNRFLCRKVSSVRESE